MNTKILKLEISSFWHAGTGAGQGALLDSVVEKDNLGLPYLPGRTLKGILRDAVYRWEQLGGYENVTTHKTSITETLFGVWGDDGNETTQGLIRVGSATMEASFKDAIAQHKNRNSLVSYLYAEHFSTKINKETGTATDKSLRGSEMAIPMDLYADITLLDHTDSEVDVFTLLEQAFPMVQAIGKHKNRGLGRTALTWTVKS